MPREHDSALVDSLPDALIGLDERRRISRFNAAAERIYGFSSEEALGKSAEQLLDTFAMDGQTEQMLEAMRLGRPWRGDVSQRRKDGTRVVLSCSAAGLGAPASGYVALTREPSRAAVVVPASRHGEDGSSGDPRFAESVVAFLERISADVNQVSSVDEALGGCLTDIGAFWSFTAGHVYSVSESTGRLVPSGLWYARPGAELEVFKARTLEVDPVEALGGPVAIVRSKHSQCFPAASRDYGPKERFDGTALAVACVVPVVVDGEVTHVLEFFDDAPRPTYRNVLALLDRVAEQLARVVERGRAERQRLYSEGLERSNRELRLFAHVASHDLQEPLRMVTSFLELLRDRYADKLDARGARYVAHAVDGAQRMMALIRSLLEYSRLETRGVPPRAVSTDLALDEALDNLRQTIRERSVAVTRDPELPIVLADDTQLVQLFQNLLSNAVKFCEQNPPRIHVGIARGDGSNHFTVKDNGIGVDAKYADRVFEIFQRLHTRDEYPGTGIGLAICRRIVERHGGKIWIESEPGRGTEVHFVLPSYDAGARA